MVVLGGRGVVLITLSGWVGFEPARGEAPIEAACLSDRRGIHVDSGHMTVKSYMINTLFVKQLAVGKSL